jgi:hypothetical protein
MPRVPIIIGSLEFKFKKDVKAYFGDMLKNSNVGDLLPHDEMVDLVKRHPDFRFSWLEDCSFVIGLTLGNKNFRIINNSGSFPISYTKCIRAAPRDKYVRARVQRAARFAIRAEIKQFRKDNPCICAISGEILGYDDLHVDHDFSKKTFQALLDEWAQNNGGYEKIRLVKNEDEINIMDSPFEASWKKFHLNKATLRMIKKQINLAGRV